MSGFVEIRVDDDGAIFTAKSFLNHLRKSNDYWWEKHDNKEVCPWVFRGHRDVEWRLIPSAFRDLSHNPLSPLIDKVIEEELIRESFFNEGSSEFKSATSRYVACYYAVKEFYKLAVEIGLYDEILNLNDAFGIFGVDPEPRGHKEYYKFCGHKIVGLAQHHGIPTPLLDWTRTPEKATHFATSGYNSNPVTDVAVYALHSGNIYRNMESRGAPQSITQAYYKNPINNEIELSFPFMVRLDAPAKNSYLAAQQGLFTLSLSLEEFLKTGKFIALEDMLSDTAQVDITLLKKFVLRKEEVPDLRKLLDREGLSEAHLKPSYDSLAETVKSRWQY